MSCLNVCLNISLTKYFATVVISEATKPGIFSLFRRSIFIPSSKAFKSLWIHLCFLGSGARTEVNSWKVKAWFQAGQAWVAEAGRDSRGHLGACAVVSVCSGLCVLVENDWVIDLTSYQTRFLGLKPVLILTHISLIAMSKE